MLKNLFNVERRKAIAKAMDLYQQIHLDNRSMTGKGHSLLFVEHGGYSKTLFGFGLLDSVDDLGSADLSQLRSEPYSRLDLYNNKPANVPEDQELFSDTA